MCRGMHDSPTEGGNLVIVIPRRVCRVLPALARKCVSGRPRGPAPPVVFAQRDGTLTAWVRTADSWLVSAVPAAGGDGEVVVPMDVQGAAAGAGDDPVELVPLGPRRGEARWRDRGADRAVPFDVVDPAGAVYRPPAPPTESQPVATELLSALHECGRTTARDPGRYAVDRVQVRGAAGEVVGTDGRTARVWGGFAQPFAADLLVPALPVFGCPELAREADVRVGRTPHGLVVAAGPWRVHLPAAGSRFPDLAAVARRDGPAAVDLDLRDAARLAARLPGLPGADAEGRPVTLELGDAVAVLARDGATGRVTRVRLSSTQTPQHRSATGRSATAMLLNTADSRTCDSPTKARGPQKSRPRVNPGSTATASYFPVAGSTHPTPPPPDSSTQSRPSYHRGECGIDSPRHTTSPDATSISTPPVALFSRQPLRVSVVPRAVTNPGRPPTSPRPLRWQRSSGASAETNDAFHRGTKLCVQRHENRVLTNHSSSSSAQAIS